MKDKDIIKALECCYKYGCKQCPLWEYKGDCFKELIEHNALDLINRQKAEIERLQAMVNAELDTIHKLGDDYERALEEEQERVKKAKAEAIKEFAERLKAEYIFALLKDGSVRKIIPNYAIYYLVKEMVGDAE